MRSLLKNKVTLVIIFIASVVLSGVSIFVALRVSAQRKAAEIDTSAARSISFGACTSIDQCKPTGCCTQGWCDGGTCTRYEDFGKCAATEVCGNDCTCQPKPAETPPEDRKGTASTSCSTTASCTTSDPNNPWKGCGDCCDTCSCDGGKCVGWRSNERCRLVLNNQSATCAANCTCEVGGESVGPGTASCYYKNGAAEDARCDATNEVGCPKISVGGDGTVTYTVTGNPNASSGYQICYCDKVAGTCENDCQPLPRDGNTVTRKITAEGFPCGTIQADDNEGYCLWKGPNDCSTPPPPPTGEMSCDNISRSPTGELSKGQNVTFTAVTKDASIVPVRAEFKITLPNKTNQTVTCPKDDPACTLILKDGKYVSTFTYKIPETGDYGVCARFCDANNKCTVTW